MKILRLLLTLLAIPSCAPAQTLPAPAYTPVTAQSDGTLRTPATFWTANQSAIASAISLSGYQPLDSDLTAISALSTQSFGRSLLTQSSASAARTALALGTSDSVSFGWLNASSYLVSQSVRIQDATDLANPSARLSWKNTAGDAQLWNATETAAVTIRLPGAGGSTLNFSGNTAGRSFTFPDSSGTVALASTTLAGYGITDAVPAARTITATAPLTVNGGSSAALSANVAIAASAASDAAAGVVELATSAEAITGTDTARANTPAAGRAALAAYVDPVAASRQALLGLMLSDGATANRRVEWSLGAAGNIAGSDLSEVGHVFRVPSSIGTEMIVWGISASSVITSATPNALLLFFTTGGSFRLLQIGATAQDWRRLDWAGFRAAYSGQLVRVDISITRGTNNPTVYLNGVDVTGSFMASSNNSAPNWMDTALSATTRACGFNWPNTEFRPGTPINRALTAAEIAQMVQTGALLPVDRLGGSNVAYVSNFAAGTDGWSENAAGQSVIAGNIDGVSGVDDVLRVTRGTTGSVQLKRDALSLYGRMYEVTFDYYLDPASGVTGLMFGGVGFPVTNVVAAVEGAWVLGARLVSITPHTILNNGLAAVGQLASGKSLYLKNISVKNLGALIQPEITRTAQVIDHGPNRIRGIATAGVRPLSDRDPVGIRGTQTATGFALGLGSADPLWFEPALITGLRIKQAAASAQTITLRLNSSGGTVIATATTAASTDWQTIALSIPGGFEVSSGDRLHWTITNQLDWDLTWSRR